jgi:hypothetical protein
MRCVLALCLLIVSSASVDAAKVRRAKPPEGSGRPSQRVTIPKSYAVPGWTEQQTQRWLDDATGPKD